MDKMGGGGRGGQANFSTIFGRKQAACRVSSKQTKNVFGLNLEPKGTETQSLSSVVFRFVSRNQKINSPHLYC
jgi:hypothetical protein